MRQYEGLAADYEGVTRQVLSGAEADAVEFETRYFEVAPGGFTRLEQHGHAHVVVVVRGAGEVLLGDRTEQIKAFDCVYVAPGERHQFRAHHAAPLGSSVSPTGHGRQGWTSGGLHVPLSG